MANARDEPPGVRTPAIRPSRVPRLGETPSNRLAIILNLPTALFVFGIVLYPILFALWVSLHRVGVAEVRSGQMPWVGFVNFRKVLSDSVFALSFEHTLVFVSVSVALEMLLGLAVAVLINRQGSRLTAAARALIILPWAVPPAINGLAWSFIYSSKYGYLNAILYKLGFIQEYVSWTGDERYALIATIVPYVWRTTPFVVLILHAALQAIPGEVYDAAEVDGAGLWTRFRHITLPFLRPAILALLVLRTTFAFMVFDEILTITGGGPGNATWVASWYVYSHAFRYFELDSGAAAAYVLTFIIGVVAVIYIKLLYREVEY